MRDTIDGGFPAIVTTNRIETLFLPPARTHKITPLSNAPAPDLRDSSHRHLHLLDLSSKISYKLVSGEEHVFHLLRESPVRHQAKNFAATLGTGHWKTSARSKFDT